MSNRLIAVMQIAVNSILLLLVSTTYFLIPVVVSASPILSRAASLDEALDTLAARPDISNVIILVALFALGCVILMLWLTKKYAAGYEGYVSQWERWGSAGLIGIIARFGWRGIRKAQEFKTTNARACINKMWAWISLVACSLAVTGICIVFWPEAPHHGDAIDPRPPSTALDFLGPWVAIGMSVLFFLFMSIFIFALLPWRQEFRGFLISGSIVEIVFGVGCIATFAGLKKFRNWARVVAMVLATITVPFSWFPLCQHD